MGITAAVTLLGGVGTTCVALNPTSYESMKAIAEYQWLYNLYVLVGVALGILGIWATIMLAKGRKQAEITSLITLLAGQAFGIPHIITSRSLRGSSMPVDGVVYITGLTLVVFLIFQIPAIKKMALFQKGAGGEAPISGGLTCIVAAGLVLSVGFWAGLSHLLVGVNYANAFQAAMTWIGLGLLVLGIGMIAIGVLTPTRSGARESIS